MHMSDRSIVMLGAGSWGTALATVLALNGCHVRLWSHEPSHVEEMKQSRENSRYLPGIKLSENITIHDSLSIALQDQSEIFIAVPSYAFRSLLEQIRPLVGDVNLGWGTKGFDVGTHMPLSQVVEEIFGKQIPMAVLSGPSFSKEVALQKPTAMSLAGNHSAWLDALTQKFHNTFFRIYKNPDLMGVQVCGAVKNVIAIAVGIADGLDMGANARSALITRGMVEISRLVAALGGRAETLLSLAGVGDLVLTCTDNQSRNRRFGFAIAKNKSPESAFQEIGQAVEGFGNASEVYQLAKLHGIEMPIAEQVYGVLYQRRSVSEAVAQLLARSPQEEFSA
jgi:glycerol-3-phosphate dehydrogenase (NAD(P)+)